MSASNYLELVNTLRDRFNEAHISVSNWASTVGFDQFTKDAINYAYSDILNAEMEWPFMHLSGSIKTSPGFILYNIIPGDNTVIKEIDWDSFFTGINSTETAIINEAQTIPASGVMTVNTTNYANWSGDVGVKYTAGSIPFVPTDTDPLVGQYTIRQGVYYFNIADAGQAILISYYTSVYSTINPITAAHLEYIDYDSWRSNRLIIDRNNIVKTSFSTPWGVYKTQKQGEFGITPVPDKIYTINFEYWVDSLDLDNPTDIPIVPERFFQVILDGAQKYCHEFREDPQLAASADKRFVAGISRMRTELINRQSTMNAGMRWYPHGFSYTLNTG